MDLTKISDAELLSLVGQTPDPLATVPDEELLRRVGQKPEPNPYSAMPDEELLRISNAGTAESYANQAKRGAVSGGLWQAGEGMANLPRSLMTGAAAGIEKLGQAQRGLRAMGLPIGAPDDATMEKLALAKQALATPGALPNTGSQIDNAMAAGDWMADAYKTARAGFDRARPVRPDVAESFSGQLVQGIGQAVPTMAAGIVAAPVLPLVAAGQINQEALDDARQKGASEPEARTTAAAYLPAAGLDYLGDRFIIGKILKPLAGKVTIGEAAKHLAGAFGMEGGTEAAQQALLNTIEKLGFKPDQELTEGVVDSFLVGGATGAAVTGGGIAASEGTRRLLGAAEAQRLDRWAKALAPGGAGEAEAFQQALAADNSRRGVPEPAAPEAPTTLPAAATPTQQGGAGETAAGAPSPQGVEAFENPVGAGYAPAGTFAEVDEVLAAEAAQAEAQRAETERRAQVQAYAARPLPDLVGEALRPRVAELAGKTDLEQHDFWRGMQQVAETLASAQAGRSRDLDLPAVREQAAALFSGAKPALVDAIALKLHGTKPAESVAALRDFHKYAGQQRQPFAAAAQARDAAEAERRAAAQAETAARDQAVQAELARTKQERTSIAKTGRDLDGRVADWTALPDTDLETLAAANEADGFDPDEIAGAQAEIERRSREQGAAQPLTREAQLRLIARYGGINPDHPVHAGEIATIRESEIGRDRKLWREDGNSLDRLAEQIRQDVQNGPQTEADVLAWLGELAAGRTPKLYERGDVARDDIRFARGVDNASPQSPASAPMASGDGAAQQSNGSPQSGPASAEFKRWFRKSKTVDFDGKPKVFFHGTRVKFSEFKEGKPIWFTDDPDAAGAQAYGKDAEVKHAYLRLEHPLVLKGTDAGAVRNLISALRDIGTEWSIEKADSIDSRLRKAIEWEEPDGQTVRVYLPEVAKLLEKKFDGVVFEDWGMQDYHEYFNSYVVFSPDQIRVRPNPSRAEGGASEARFAQAAAPADQFVAANKMVAPAADPAARRKIARLEKTFRRIMPALFRDVEVRIDDVGEALAAEGHETPEGVEAVYLPRPRAQRDLIVLAADVALRDDGRTGLARMLHESVHAYWRMLSPETRAALRRLYDRDLREQWSPLWRDGELNTEVSQDDILSGDELGLEEWFSELMAALNAEWATRRGSSRVPGWVQDLATTLREILAHVWRTVAHHKGLRGDALDQFLNRDFRAFLTRGVSARRTAAAGAAFARHAQAQGRRTATDTPEFRAWFGKSKIVDDNGKPLVVWHGSRAGDFPSFSKERIGSVTDLWFSAGFYFTPDETTAASFADLKLHDREAAKRTGADRETGFYVSGDRNLDGRALGAFYLRAENPYHYRAHDTADSVLNARDFLAAVLPEVPWPKRTPEMATAALRANGHDGVVVEFPFGEREFVVFDPDQIKSAYNRGTWSRTDARVRYAASQKIVAAKQVDATPTDADRTRAQEWIRIMPAFQGGKYQMAEPAAALIRQHWTAADREKITAITDYFGGGGWWGSYLALTHLPKIQRITINEYDALRAAKIRLLHEAPERLAEMLADAKNRQLIDAVIAEANADEATSGSALARRIRQLRLQFTQADPGLAGLLIDATMSARGRAVDDAGVKTAEATADKVMSIALRDATDAAKGAAALRARGIRVEVVQGDAYARPIEQGEHVLAVFDPPYYLTTGYNGKRVPLGIYENTAATIRELAANGNAILYTDSGWWLDNPDKAQATPDIFSGDMADRAALSGIVDSLTAVGIVPVEKRHEIIGINRPGETHGQKPSRGADRTTAGAGRDGSAGRAEGDRGRGEDHPESGRGRLAGEPAPAARPVPAVAEARERFEAADARVRDLESRLAELAESQADNTESTGRALQRELAEARRERNKAYALAATARAVEADPVSKVMAQDPTVRALRDEKIKLRGELDAAQKEGRPTDALLARRDAINNDQEAIRHKIEQGTFPLTYDAPVAFGDANPPRNTEPPPVAAGAPDPDHLRPIIIDDFTPYTGPQLAERLARLKQLQAAIGGDDLEQSARLSFLANLVRATREEMEARRAALERQAEIDAIGEAKTAPEAQAAHEDEELAREEERAAQTDLDAEAAAAIPDAPEETYPVRENVEEAGAAVSAATLAPKSRLSDWFEKLGELLRGFRSAVPELPTFKGAERFATFREGLRLLRGLDEVVRHDAEEAVAEIVEPLQKLSTRGARDTQARLQELRRQIATLTDENAKKVRMAAIKKLEAELANDPWWIFQNVVLYGDLFTRSRLYRRDDDSPISLPGGLNPAEAEHLFKQWLTRAHAHPHKGAILKARARHKAFVGRIAADLQARGFAFAEGANTNYFPHVMLERWDGNLARVKAGTASDFRAYLISPVGSTKPIETDYLKAMYYHAVQVMAHNRRADILRDFVAREDIKPRLIEEAKEARRRDPDQPPVTWQQIFHSRYSEEFDIYAPDPDEIPLHPELVLDRDALAKRLGMVLGNGPLQEELKKRGFTSLPLQPGEIQEMLVAGAKELWVLPKPVAEALRGVNRRAKQTDNLVTQLLAGTQGLWKRNILFAPWNWIRFDFNNAVSDIEKVLVADPAMARGVIDAGREVYQFVTGNEKASEDVRLAFRLGVLDTLTAAEVNALRAQRPFEAWETSAEAWKRASVNRLTSYLTSSRWNTMEWSKLREATLRFAKFKADLDRMRHGATPQYGGAYWRNVEALSRIGAPEEITEIDRLGRAIGRQGPGSGRIMSATPYILQWKQGSQRREEAFASPAGRAKRRAELESQQQAADAELLARKAAAISRATFGDYGELTPNGDGLRRLLIPFWSWTEVNFRYHANLFRNMHDMLRRGDIGPSQAAGQVAKQAAALGARAGMGMVLRLALPYLAVGMWNAMMFGDDEEDLSEEDRRRFHLLLGRDDDGKIRAIYLPTAFSDVLKWFSGNRAAALVGDVAAGRTDWGTVTGEFATNVVPDFLNNTIGSVGPVVKTIYTASARKSTFPDVTDQRTIPGYDLRRVIVGQMTDQTTAEMIERAVNKDYVSPRSMGEWAQQAILQVRRRDPESWAFYAIKDKAAQFEEAKTGRRENRAALDAPEAQVLRQYRRAIYQADVPTAMRMYQRLLELGYTAERFEASIRSQDPLHGLPSALRRSFVASLSTYEREQLRTAYRYYLRMQELEGSGRRLFPRAKLTPAGRQMWGQYDRSQVLADEIARAQATQDDDATAEQRIDRELAEALRRN